MTPTASAISTGEAKKQKLDTHKWHVWQQFPSPIRIGDRTGWVLLSMWLIAVDLAIAEDSDAVLTAIGRLPRSLTI